MTDKFFDSLTGGMKHANEKGALHGRKPTSLYPSAPKGDDGNCATEKGEGSRGTNPGAR